MLLIYAVCFVTVRQTTSLTKDRAIIVESINGNYRQLFLLHFNSEVTQLLNNTDSLLT